ncbi:hypothetical protein [Arthrobacter zhaoxinii]|uniref:hypothetical protein n=1 Tax=Arthrobacter zhaoxinii TaxID=2964616 RepID=UPI0021061217|nr:hypothetical protein [Arthrobacter zhaoxinii]MCQ1999543.1 hypothetical protein [Arthrobacter zhaoxinii]
MRLRAAMNLSKDQPLDQPNSVSQEEADPYDVSGIGIGFGFALFGLVVLLVPRLLPLSHGWVTVVMVASMIITMIGVGGIFFEVEKRGRHAGLGELGTVVVLFGLAGAVALLHLRETSLPAAVHVILVLVLLLLLFWVLVGLGMGLSKFFQARALSSSTGTSPLAGEAPVARLARADRVNIGVALGSTALQIVLSVAPAFAGSSF